MIGGPRAKLRRVSARDTSEGHADTVNVVYVVNTYPGAFTFVADEIEHLRKLGARVHPVSLNSADQRRLLTDRDRDEVSKTLVVKAQPKVDVLRTALAEIARDPRQTISAMKTVLSHEPWNLRQVIWRLFYLVEATVVVRHAREVGATHIHAHFGGAPSSIAWFATLLDRRLTWSFTVHGPHDFFDERTNQLDSKVEAAAFTVAISDYARSQLIRLAGSVAEQRVAIVRCGIDLDRFPFSERDRSGSTSIVTTARLAPEKGQAVLIDAVALLRQRGCDVSLDLIGSGPSRAELETRVANLGVGDAVRFHGEQSPDAVATLLEEAAVFCLPSFAEGLPVSIMEAMAVGVPVVATAVNGTPELVVDGITGTLVVPGNVDALANAIERVLRERSTTMNFTLAARRAVEAAHDARVSASSLAQLFADPVALGCRDDARTSVTPVTTSARSFPTISSPEGC